MPKVNRPSTPTVTQQADSRPNIHPTKPKTPTAQTGWIKPSTPGVGSWVPSLLTWCASLARRRMSCRSPRSLPECCSADFTARST